MLRGKKKKKKKKQERAASWGEGRSILSRRGDRMKRDLKRTACAGRRGKKKGGENGFDSGDKEYLS